MTPDDRTRLEIEADYRELQRKHLERQLWGALREYEKGDADARREGVLLALAAVLDHVHNDLRVDRAAIRPLDDLCDAIWDADRGARNELLKPRKVEHRPPLSSRKLALMRAVAIAIDLRMMARDSKEEAARQVARKVKSFGIKLGGKRGTPDWKIITEWRDRLSAARLRGSPEHLHFAGILYHYDKLGLQDAIKEPGRNPNELLARQFEKLRSFV